MFVEERTSSSPEVVVATSEADAIAAFGDGVGVTVVAGGTVVVPALWHGLLRPERALMLRASALDEVVAGNTLTVGATVTLARLADVAPEPLASAAKIPDIEIRAQGTVGGNLIIGGDLQPALIALGARIRSVGAGGPRLERVDEFLASSEPRLVLAVEVDRPLAGVYVEQRRLHSSTYAVLSVAVARRHDGVHVAVGGLYGNASAVACPSVDRALAEGSSARSAAEAVVEDTRPEDDPLASAWYRKRVLPVLVARALEQLEEAT